MKPRGSLPRANLQLAFHLVIFLVCLVNASLGASSWTVRLGFEPYTSQDPVELSRSLSWLSTRFYPSALTINQYDTVTFAVAFNTPKGTADQPNYVAISSIPGVQVVPFQSQSDGSIKLHPALVQPTGGQFVTSNETLLSSGLLGPSLASPFAYYSLTFGTTGAFAFRDLFHYNQAASGATFQLNVVSTTDSLDTTPAMVEANAKQAIAIDSAARQSLESNNSLVATAQPPSVVNPDGVHHTFTVNIGFRSDAYQLSYLRFLPNVHPLRLGKGDTVRFVLGDTLPHIIAIIQGNNSFADTFVALGPDNLTIPKMYAQRSSVSVTNGYDPSSSGVISSGLVFGDPIGTQAWNVTFNAVGDYHVKCVLNRGNGMELMVTVEEIEPDDNEHEHEGHDESHWQGAVGIFLAILAIFYSVMGLYMS